MMGPGRLVVRRSPCGCEKAWVVGAYGWELLGESHCAAWSDPKQHDWGKRTEAAKR